MSSTPQDPIYKEGSCAQRKVHAAGMIAAFSAVASIAWSVLSALYPQVRSQLVSGGLAAMWAVCAPVWFWFEYYFIYRGKDGGLPDSFEHFKQGQQTAVAIWAGLSAALGAFAASDYSKPPSSKYECKIELSRDLRTMAPPPSVPLTGSTLICNKGASGQFYESSYASAAVHVPDSSPPQFTGKID